MSRNNLSDYEYNTPRSRIMIFGRPGSGKSTFSQKVHQRTGLSLYHLDKYFYTENWTERNYQQFLNIQQKLVDQDQWIIDGNNLKSLEMRYHRADLCLYFNYPRWLCYWRIFKRLFTKDRTIHDRAEGCRETIRWSLLSYIWTFEQRVAQQIKALRHTYPHVTFVKICDDKELQKIESQLFGNPSI